MEHCGAFFFPVVEFCAVIPFVREAMILFRQWIRTQPSVMKVVMDRILPTIKRVTITWALVLNMV